MSSKDLNEDHEPRDFAEVNVAKNRDGATGVIKLLFNEETVSFADADCPEEANSANGTL